MAIARWIAFPMLLAALSSMAQTPEFASRGLVAFYPFDGDARDAGPSGYDAVVHGAHLGIDRFGFGNSAYSFNGTSDFLDAGNLDAFNFGTGDFTLSAWFQSSGPNHNSYIVGKWADGLPSGYGLGLASSAQIYGFIVAPPPFVETFGGPSTSDGKWHHLVASYTRAGSLVLYLDGVSWSIVSIAAKSGSISNTVPLTIGKLGAGLFYQGLIDDVRVYNRALDSGDVLGLYQFESAPRGTHPAAATPQIINTFVVGATVTAAGSGYTNAPTVRVIGSGTGATAVAQIKYGSLVGITIVAPGAGYGPDTTFSIDPPPQTPRRARAIVEVTNGFAANIVVTDGGFGYTSAPSVSIVGDGSGATATATVTDGVVVGLAITTPGSGYTTPPTVAIGSPVLASRLSIGVSKVRVSQSLVIGQRYVLESSDDLSTWTPAGAVFVAYDPVTSLEVDATQSARQYRIRAIP